MDPKHASTHPVRSSSSSRGRSRLALGLALALTSALALVTPAQAAQATAPPASVEASAAVAAPAAEEEAGPDVSAAVEREVAGLRKDAAPSVRVIAVLDAPSGTGPRPSAVGIRNTRAAVLADLPKASYDVVSSFARVPAVSLEVNAESLAALAEDPRVVAVNEDHVIRTNMEEANAITGADEAHTLGFTGAGQTVAIIDTGVDSSGGIVHAGLADDLVGQACFRTENDCIGGAASAEDQDGHGTHVAGIITGPQGVAPDAEFYALKVFTTGSTSDTNILNALNHVISLNTTSPGAVDLVNMSLGGASYADETTCNAANAAYLAAFATLNAQGTTVFVATGNDASTASVGGPACVTGAVGVGSTGDATFTASFSACTDNAVADKVSCFSNATPVQGAGELVDVLAPGCDIASLGLDGATGVGSCGTSMATPYAAGAAAVVLEGAADAGDTITPAELETRLEDTGVAISDYRLPGGSPTFPRVDVMAALGSSVAEAPTGLQVTASTTTSVSLAWDASAGATEYRLYRSVNGAATEQVGSTVGTALTDSGIPCGELGYTVRAWADGLPSGPSNEVTVTPRACPGTPTGLTLSPLDADTHHLAWSDANADETAMVLQRSVAGAGFTDYQSLDPGSSFTYDDTVATCGRVEYRVLAERGADRSAPSDVVARGMCAPANDDLADALAVTPGAISSTHTETVPGIAYATEEAGDPAFSCKFGGAAKGFHGVWYSITPTETARVTISTATTTILDPAVDNKADTVMAVYNALPSPSSEVSCNDDASGSVYTSVLTRNLTAGTTYYVHVALWSDLPDTTAGDLVTTFSWITPVDVPSNDLWADAAEIDASPYSLTVLNAQNATVSGGDPAHACRASAVGVGNHTTWWTITPEFDGKLDLSTAASSGSFTDTIVSVYTGGPGAFTGVACNDDISGANLRSALTDVPVTGGTTYSIIVSRWATTATGLAGTVVLDATYDALPGISRSKTTVAVDENGTDDSYTLTLHTQPAADVVVTVTGDDDCAVDQGTLTFTPVNWETPQAITVSGIPDDIVEGEHTCEIVHGVQSADPDYDARSVPFVTGTVLDLLTTDIAITTPADGAEYEQGEAVTADFACTDNRGGEGIASCVGDVADGAAVDTSVLGAQDFTVVLTDVYGTETELTSSYTVVVPPGITVSPTSVAVDEDGVDDTYDVVLDEPPTDDVTVTVSGDEDCAVDPASLTFTTADWATPQTVTVSAVPDDVVEGDHTCTVTHEVASGDPDYGGLAVADVNGTVGDTTPVRRPDARVGLGAGALIGDDVYNRLAGQTKAAAARKGRSVTYRVSVQNDGTAAEALRVTGAGSARGFTVKYVGPTGANLTRAVTRAGFVTPVLAPGATYLVKVQVTVGRRALSALSRDVTVRSTAQPARTDVVRLITKRKGR